MSPELQADSLPSEPPGKFLNVFTPPLILGPDWKRPTETKILLGSLFDLGSTVSVINSDNHTYCAGLNAIATWKRGL